MVLCPDRLARKYAYQVLILEELERFAVRVIFLEQPPSEDPHTRLLVQIQGAIAEYERMKITERDRRGNHAERGADNHGGEGVEARRQGHRRELGLVAHLDEEERDQRRDEGARPREAPVGESGWSAHSPKAMNDSPTTQSSIRGAIRLASHTPMEPARAWLARVARRMPAMMA